MVEVLREGYVIPFHTLPPLSENPIFLDSYSPSSIKGEALQREIQALLSKGAVEPASPCPGYYSRMFVVSKATGGWRPIIDLSVLNKSVVKTRFHMETSRSVLRSVRKGDWMVTIDLKDAYLQIPIHPSSRRYLRFMAGGRAWQFRVLCFGFSTAPQVFTRVMAPVAVFLHRLGVRVLRYLDDWLILASSYEDALRARDIVLDLCLDLGIWVNLGKSSLEPSQIVTYLGIKIDSQIFRASATPVRIERFFSITEEFLSSREQSAKSWRILLGHLASLAHLVPGGMLRMRALQLALRRGWNFLDESILVPWDDPSRDDLLWWCAEGRLEEGVSLELTFPDRMFWSDASDQGWGATLVGQFASGLWSKEELPLSINARELLAVEKGLRAFQEVLRGQTVAVFADNMTALAYLRRQGGTFSPFLNELAQKILRWAESQHMVLLPQFVQGKRNVVADVLSRPHQVIGSEWTLHQEVFDDLRKRWPVVKDLFASSLNHRCVAYFATTSDPMAVGVDAMLQCWDFLQVYAFPPFAMVRPVLNKLRVSKGVEMTLIAPLWSQKEWFPDLLEHLLEPPFPLPQRWDLLRQPHVRRFHQNLSKLRLHAWRLSSAMQKPQGSLLAWLEGLSSLGDNLP